MGDGVAYVTFTRYERLPSQKMSKYSDISTTFWLCGDREASGVSVVFQFDYERFAYMINAIGGVQIEIV